MVVLQRAEAPCRGCWGDRGLAAGEPVTKRKSWQAFFAAGTRANAGRGPIRRSLRAARDGRVIAKDGFSCRSLP